MSPSKKPIKKDSAKNARSTQKGRRKTSVRSARVPANKRASQKSSPSKSITAVSENIATPTVQVIQADTQSTSESSSFGTNILRVLALVVVVAITIYIISIRDRVTEFKQYGYVGIFFVALLANATVFIPAPGVAIIYAMGAVFNPFYVGMVAGTGGAIGELSGFLAGFSGQAVVERTHLYEQIKPQVDKYGGWAILVLSAIPNPFFDIAGFAAGIAKMKMRTFLFSVWIGQLIKMTLFAFAGKYSVEWIANFLK